MANKSFNLTEWIKLVYRIKAERLRAEWEERTARAAQEDMLEWQGETTTLPKNDDWVEQVKQAARDIHHNRDENDQG